jgi:DNA-binding NarL/FixJ family response regulator
VAIAADSPVVRAGLEALAASSDEVQVSGSFADFAGALEGAPDVVLAAMAPPAEGTPMPVVLLTNDPHPEWSAEALRLGVRAMLPRDASPAEILAAVEAAAHGMAVIPPAELDVLLAGVSPVSVQSDVETSELTGRELDVLRMLAEGAANKIIAWKLGISEHTVKFHVASILGRLGARSRTEAVTIAIRRGLVLL